jgi:hypothetical protein
MYEKGSKLEKEIHVRNEGTKRKEGRKQSRGEGSRENETDLILQ